MNLTLSRLITLGLITITMFMGLVSNANAELQSRLNGQAVYDTDLNLTWLADANAGGLLNQKDAESWANSLSIDGVTGWRLPVAGASTWCNPTCTNGTFGHLFYDELSGIKGQSILNTIDPELGLFSNIQPENYWVSRRGSTHPTMFNFGTGEVLVNYNNVEQHGAWAVWEGDVNNFDPNKCYVNCVTVGGIRLVPSGTENRVLTAIISATHRQFAILNIVWTLPDGSTIEGTASGRGVRGYRPRISLPALPQGEYKITVVGVANTQDGYIFDPENSTILSRTINFTAPNPNNGAIGGYVWNDDNANGNDDNESRRLEVPVYLTDCNGTVLRTSSTQNQGLYNFSGIASGNYKVKVDAPVGTHFSPKNTGASTNTDSDINPQSSTTDCISLVQNEHSLNINAGLVTDSSLTVYEDAENGNTIGWGVYDNSPAGATIRSVLDLDNNSRRVIELSGSATRNGYRLGHNNANHVNAWGNTTEKVLSWDSKFSEYFVVYAAVQTRQGFRYLYYTPSEGNRGINTRNSNYIHHGVGAKRRNGQWQTITRDLEADLKEFEPSNSIISVNGFLIRGSGRIDNITLHKNVPPPPPAPAKIIYENAEDGNTAGWGVYDKKPAGATISNVFDTDKNNNVIELSGSATKNGYRLGHNNVRNPKAWGNTDHKTISWDSKYNESFVVYIGVQTTSGFRYLYYTPSNSDRGISSNSKYIHHGLGSDKRNGIWHTITRNLESDLRDFEPDNRILSVNGFLIRGSGRVDNIEMK